MSPAAWSLRLAPAALLAAALLPAPLAAKDPDKPSDAKPALRGTVEARFADGSAVRLTLKDDRIDVVTPYGKLQVPLAEVVRIELGTRIPEDVASRIETAIGKLGSDDFNERETSSSALLALRERAYPALLQAASSKDPEVA